MNRKRHKKGSREGGRFAKDLSGMAAPKTVSPVAIAEPNLRTCRECKSTFPSPDNPWAQLCNGCLLNKVHSLQSEATERGVTPLSLPGAPEIKVAEMVEVFEEEPQNLTQYKGNGKFDYLLEEGEHFEVLQDDKAGTEFRRLTESGRREFGKLIKRLGPPLDWPTPIKEFAEKNGIPLSALPSGRTSMEFHLVSILAAHPEYAFGREDLTEFRSAYSAWYKRRENVTPRPRNGVLDSGGDPIQQVNKTGQWGLQHQTVYSGSKRQPYYMLREPYTFLASARKLRASIALDPSDKEAQIARIKRLVEETWLVPSDQWEQGHTDPDDDSPAVWQPGSFQRSRRDRFKFDENGFVLAPTVKELLENPGKYYSPGDWDKIAAAINDMPSSVLQRERAQAAAPAKDFAARYVREEQ